MPRREAALTLMHTTLYRKARGVRPQWPRSVTLETVQYSCYLAVSTAEYHSLPESRGGDLLRRTWSVVRSERTGGALLINQLERHARPGTVGPVNC